MELLQLPVSLVSPIVSTVECHQCLSAWSFFSWKRGSVITRHIPWSPVPFGVELLQLTVTVDEMWSNFCCHQCLSAWSFFSWPEEEVEETWKALTSPVPFGVELLQLPATLCEQT